jgi:murein DD-endopeptidase MepM/ murein hydrolase activator NlpD
VVVTEQHTPDMLVVLDSDPNSLAPLTIAQRYAAGTVLLASWDADPLEVKALVQSSATAEPTISEALHAAAQRGMPWVGIRRDFAAPEQLLTELMVATARHSHDVVPGFAVFLANGDPPPFRHILAIVDRSDGPISGLLAFAAVAVADTAGAQLDILVIGDEHENPHTEDELEALIVSREQELYDAAVERAQRQGVVVTWITAASVRDLWRVVSDQLSQHDYDLVIDDLGDVSLARLGTTNTAGGALADGAAGEIPLKLLTHTDLPLLLVMDEIRLRLAPPALLKAGAMVAIALGIVSAQVAAAAAAPAPATAARDQHDTVGTLITDLQAALGTSDDQGTAASRAQAAARTARGASDTGARATAEQVVPQPTAYAPQAAAVPTGTEEAAAAAESQAASEDGASSEPEPPAPTEEPAVQEEPEAPEPPKPPKGGASPTQVAKAAAQAAEDKAALEKDKAQRAKAKEAVAEAQAAHAEAETAAAVALADLEAATMSHAETATHSAALQSSTTGLASMLPGTPTEEEVTSAQIAEQAAAERLATAVATGQEALAALESAAQVLADEQAALDGRTADVQETKAEYQQSKEKAAVYKKSLAETRQAPMAKGTYRLTARFGQTGGYWSSGVHTGLDFAGPTGTPILAAASGKVVSTGYEGSYGNQIIIDHGDGYQTTYNHLSGIGVSVGDKVSTGDQIGRRGSTGNSTGAHLHFEVTKDGKFVDPEGWLGW